MSIKTKLIILFLSVAIIPLGFVGLLTFRHYGNSLESSYLERLRITAETKIEKMENFFSQERSAAEVLRNAYVVRQMLKVLGDRAGSLDDPEFIQARSAADELLSKASSEFEISDIMLADHSGKIVYSSNPAYDSRELGISLNRIKEGILEKTDNSGIYTSDIFPDHIGNKSRPLALISARVYDYNQNLSGFLVLKLDLQSIYSLLGQGLGQTGETLIARKEGNHVLFLNALRYDPDAAFKRTVPLDSDTAFGVRKAAAGESGTGQFLDYRGKKVLGIWRYIPSLGLGMVVKIDASEAFAEVTNLGKLILIILAIVFVLSALMAVVIVQSIAGPIKKLSSGVKRFSAGLDFAVNLKGKDEIGQLAYSFENMARELNRLSAARDAERKRFYDVLETLPVYVALLDKDYRIPFANKFFRERFGESKGRRCHEYLFNLKEPCENCESYKVLKTGSQHHWEWDGPDGRNYDIYDYPFTDSDGSSMILEMGIDITEQKKAQDELIRASHYSRSLLEASLDPLVTISADGKITDVNEATIKVTGRSRQQLIGTEFPEYFTEPLRAKAGYQEVFSRGQVKDYPLTIRHQNGSLTDVLYNATVYKDDSGGVLGVFAAARDVTALKLAEDELKRHRDKLEDLVKERTSQLRENEERLAHALEAGGFGIWGLDIKTGKAWRSLRHDQIFGYKELLPEWTYQMFLDHVLDEDRAQVEKKFGQALAEKTEWKFECRIRSNGQIRWIWAQGRPKLGENKEVSGLIGLVQDITERKLIEKTIIRERTNLQAMFDVVNIGLLLINEEGQVKRVNQTISSWLGADVATGNRQPGDIVGCVHAMEQPGGCGNALACLTCPIRQAFQHTLKTGESVHKREVKTDLLLQGKQQEMWFEVSVDPLVLDEKRHAIISMNNITTRKIAEERLQRINCTLQALSHIDHSVIVAENENEFLKTACDIIIKDCGYPLIWIGYAENDPAKTVRPVASAGFDEGYVQGLNISWADNERGRGPTGEAIRTGEPRACTDMLTDPRFKPWRQEAVKRGYASSFVVPLKDKSRIFGAVCFYFKQARSLSEEEKELLVELVDDMAYGIFSIRLRQAHLRAVSALRESEERYKRIVLTSPEAILVQSSGKIRFANPAAMEMFKAKDYGQFFNRPVLSVVEKNYYALAKQGIRSAQDGDQAGVEMKLVRLDGSVFDASITGRSIAYAGKPAVQLIVRDITGIKKAQEILMRDKEALEKLVEQKAKELLISERKFEEAKRLSDIGTLAATVAHELRNPLAAIKMAAYNAQKKAQNPLLDRHFSNIEIKLHESETIIDNLLFYSKIRMPQTQEVNIYSIIGSCINDARARFASQKISIIRRDDNIKELLVEADPVQIKEVFANVLNNSFDAVDGDGCVQVEASQDAGWLNILIRDNGPGIDPDNINRVFEPFFSTKAKGTGLGLAVCRQIISLHNGTIGIRNNPDKGAAVEITLPLRRSG